MVPYAGRMQISLASWPLAAIAVSLVVSACTDASRNPPAMSNAEQLEQVMRAGQAIEAARNAPFDEAQFRKDLAIARRPFDACVQDQIDHGQGSLKIPNLTPEQTANLLLARCHSKLQPINDLIYMSPLANKPTESRKVIDQVLASGKQHILEAL